MRKQDIFDHIEIDSGSGCWNWTRGKNGVGYGVCYIPKAVLAHRAAYEVAKGPIPPGQYVCHSCDNPACINPAHLWAGTHNDNMADMRSKSRGAKPPIHAGRGYWKRKKPSRIRKGEQVSTSTLTAETVIAIRQAYVEGMPRKDIAEKFGISPLSVSDYVSGRSWGHLADGPTIAELKAARRFTAGAKITRKDAAVIRRRLARGELGKDLAVEYGVHKATISDIKLRKIWA